MRIQVVRCDGRTETINLIGKVLANESAPGEQGSLFIEATGTTYFFRAEDGAYDGWSMNVSDAEGKLSEEDLAKLIDAVEKDREIHQIGKVA